MSALTKLISSVRAYGMLFAAGLVGVLTLIIRRKNEQLQKGKIEVSKSQDALKLEPLKEKINEMEKEVALDEKAAAEAEARLRASLATSDMVIPECQKR